MIEKTVEYVGGDFCGHIKCRFNEDRKNGSKLDCYSCRAYQFHQYLKKNQFKISKMEVENE